MRDIIEAHESGDEKSSLAFNAFVHRAKQYIGAYTAELGCVDAVVFTGGIGENSYKVRKAICKDMKSIGIDINLDENEKFIGTEGVISADDSQVKVFVIPTDEEYVIAMDGFRLANGK